MRWWGGVELCYRDRFSHIIGSSPAPILVLSLSGEKSGAAGIPLGWLLIQYTHFSRSDLGALVPRQLIPKSTGNGRPRIAIVWSRTHWEKKINLLLADLVSIKTWVDGDGLEAFNWQFPPFFSPICYVTSADLWIERLRSKDNRSFNNCGFNLLEESCQCSTYTPLTKDFCCRRTFGDFESVGLQQPLFLPLLWHDLLRKSCRKGLEWKVLDCSAEREIHISLVKELYFWEKCPWFCMETFFWLTLHFTVFYQFSAFFTF